MVAEGWPGSDQAGLACQEWEQRLVVMFAEHQVVASDEPVDHNIGSKQPKQQHLIKIKVKGKEQ